MSKNSYVLSQKDKDKAIEDFKSVPSHMKFQSPEKVYQFLNGESMLQSKYLKSTTNIFSKKHVMNIAFKNKRVLSPI